MKTLPKIASVIICLCGVTATLPAQVPSLINYQGRVVVGTTNFDGSGQFKFALVNSNGTTAYWSNDGSLSLAPGAITPSSQPTNAATLTVTKGLYSVLLGDNSITNMTALPGTVFTNSDVRLRVWFNDGVNGSQLLSPDQRLAPTAYLADGSVTSAKLGTGAVGAANIANGAVGTAQLASGAVTSSNIANGAVGSAQLAAGAIATAQTIAGTTQAAQANTSYVATSASPTTLTLPSAANVGDVVQVSGLGAGGWAFDLWTPRDSSRSWQAVASSADGTKLLAAESGGQIYTSTDLGLTWTPRDSNRSWTALASSADGTKLVAADATPGKLYTSTNSGVNWTARDSNRSWQAVASSADGSKLVAVDFGGFIYTSTNSGANWTSRDSGRNWYSVASSSDGSKLVAVVQGGQIYTSTDSGVTWASRDSGRAWYSVASSADGTKLVASVSGGQIYTSTDSGLTWTARDSFHIWRQVASSADGTRLVALAVNGYIYTSTDSGVSWTPRQTDMTRTWGPVASSNDGTKLVAAVAGGQIYTGLAISGTQGSNATVQYLGNGLWQAVKANQIAAGAVGTTELGLSAVTSANIAPAAVSSTQLASGLTLAGTTAGTFSGNGSGITSLNASNLSSGTLANSLTTGTNNNTANTLILRDASGNFSAGTITASLAGNAATATSATNAASSINFTGSLAGEVTGTQGFTVVSNATSANTASAIVRRDASGNFTAGTITANGSALTNLNASSITTGTLPAAQLPATVALRTGGNTFTGLQTLSGDGSMEHTQAATAGAASFMEFDDSTGGSVFRGIYGADGPFFSGATNQFTIATWTNSPLAFYTNQTRRMTILGNGNVGIGTATPAVALDVAGTINGTFSGNGSALTSVSAANITSGGLLPALNGSALTSLNAANITSGGILPALNGSALTSLNAANITSGGTLPALNGSALTALNASNVSSGTISNNRTTGVSAPSAGNTLVLRDANGDFSAHTITASLTGNASTATSATSATTAGSATNFSGSLVGDVTGGQNTTSILATTVTGKALAGFSSTTGTITAADTILSGIDKLYGNDALKAPLASPSFTGAVNIPTTVDTNTGVIQMNGTPILSAKGTQNIFLGNGAGNFTLTGATNTAIGASSLVADTTGSGNTAAGVSSLSGNTSGFNNTATGSNALLSNSTASNNVAMGESALRTNTTGANNAAIGTSSLRNNNGSFNTAIGTSALTNNTSGHDNIALGNNAGQTISTGSNNIDIGSDAAAAAEANTIRIGTTGTHTATYLAGTVNITGDGSREKTQAATAGAASFMEFDDSTGGSVFRGIYGADGPGFSGATNQFTIATWTNSPLAFYTNQTRRMTILANGLVGIGGSAPTHGTLEIGAVGGSYTTAAASPFFNSAVFVWPGILGAGTYGSAIYANGDVVSTGIFVAISDERVKNIIGRSDAARDLSTLLGIEITDYRYKDVITHGDAPFKKVIAQQVEKVFPQAVKKQTGEVPDIYKLATIKDGWIALATDLKQGERVKLITDEAQGVYEVLEVQGGAFRTDFKPATEKVFVYGREVKDFRAVDYEAIAMLNVSATQQMQREIESLRANLVSVEKARNIENAANAQRLATLETRDKEREARLARIETSIPPAQAVSNTIAATRTGEQ